MRSVKILFIGPQGSGKSTQGKLLAEFLSLSYLSTGDIFRSKSGEDSEEGKKIKEILESGKLVDNKTTSEIVKEKLSDKLFGSGFVMDGYPRNFEQMTTFDPDFDIVFYLKVPEEILLERLTSRGRVDDTPESIKVRLDNYFQQTEPLISCFKQKGILKEIDGMGSVDEIHRNLKNSFQDGKN